MTLEQTTRHILAAVKAQDLAALEAAARERAAVISRLSSLPATPELRGAIAASLEAGEEAQKTIRAIRRRLRGESRRLQGIENGFLRALRPAVKHRIDYQG
jgi:hypothetical protein